MGPPLNVSPYSSHCFFFAALFSSTCGHISDFQIVNVTEEEREGLRYHLLIFNNNF